MDEGTRVEIVPLRLSINSNPAISTIGQAESIQLSAVEARPDGRCVAIDSISMTPDVC